VAHLAVAVAALATLVLAGVADATAGRTTVPASDWTTYHHDRLRTGDGVLHGTFTSLTPKFVWHLPTTSSGDQLFATPLVVGHTAFVTTLADRVFAVSTQTGKTQWFRTLGTPYVAPSGVCGNVGPPTGVVSTPVIDEARGELFVVGALGVGSAHATPVHHLFGLSLRTGAVLLNRVIDPPGQQVAYLLQRSGLALDHGRVLVGFGGNYGDCGTYHGWLESVPEAGGSAIYRFEVAKGPGQGRGAIWMGGGAPTVDAAGDVYVADGNGNGVSAGDAFDFSDAVLKLSPTMHLLDYFAPTTWYSDNAADLDLGSGAPQLVSATQLLQVGKTQTAYLLNPAKLGHVTAAVPTFPVCVGKGQANGGDALVGGMVVIPCEGGLEAVRITTHAPYGVVVWSTNVSGNAPVVADGLVWTIAGNSGGSTLYALDPANGHVRWHYDFGPVTNHFDSSAVGDNLLVVAGANELLAFPPR